MYVANMWWWVYSYILLHVCMYVATMWWVYSYILLHVCMYVATGGGYIHAYFLFLVSLKACMII